jgi:hypothetical protein
VAHRVDAAVRRACDPTYRSHHPKASGVRVVGALPPFPTPDQPALLSSIIRMMQGVRNWTKSAFTRAAQMLEGHASDIGGEQTISRKIERERAFAPFAHGVVSVPIS